MGLEKQVPLLDGPYRPYVFLDNAASTPVFKGVRHKVDGFSDWSSSVHRGTGFKSLLATEAYEKEREIAAQFLGADTNSHAVIFVRIQPRRSTSCPTASN
ncbi:MAG: aminotransferase class V-fold PLP-dependent enzyme [Anaerolineales bacterium]|nr:aminotransferase class V-fold PLP-dependent enzyme [Anaerolineales bacterium]